MTQRLTPEQEEWCRYLASGGGGDFTEEHCDLAAKLLAEIDALRAELAGAEERGAARERADVVAYLRKTPAWWTLGQTPWGRAAQNIERGEHVRTGTTAPDGGDSGP